MPTVLLEGVYKISFNSGGVRCGGVIEGLEQQGQSHHEKSLRLPNVLVCWKSRSITHLGNYLSQNLPIDFTDESFS